MPPLEFCTYTNTQTMNIILNGEAREFADILSAANLVKSLQIEDKRFAMEVNEELVPRSTFDEFELHDGDKVEIVGAIGGG